MNSVYLGMLALALTLPVPAQELVNDLLAGGSVEARAVYSSGQDADAYRAELVHRSLLELRLDTKRFVLAHRLTAATAGSPELVLERAYLSLGLGSSGWLDIGRQEVALGLGYLFEPIDPLAGADGRSSLDGLVLVFNSWANHGFKAILALDGLWDDSGLDGGGIDGTSSGKPPLSEAWRELFYGIRYDGLVGAWEPGLAFYFRHGEFLRLAASSRLGLGPAIVRLEGAWDFEQPYLYPTGDEADPAAIEGQRRAKPNGGPAGGGMGLAGIDLYLYPYGATLALGLEYAYQSRGFDRKERLLALAYASYQASLATPSEPPWGSEPGHGQWDTRHRLGFHAALQPWDRLSLRALLALNAVYPEGIAGGMLDAGIELSLPENVDLTLHVRQGWAGKPWDTEPLHTAAGAGFRVHY